MPNLYVYVDEFGDEGYPKGVPYTDASAYRNRYTHPDGPSSFFAICGVLIKDESRAAVMTEMRALAARLFPHAPNNQIHWRNLKWEQKQEAASTCSQLDFKWVACVAYKPKMANILLQPLLYNHRTRFLLERACLEAAARGRDLIAEFSSRSRTRYDDLENYVVAEMEAFGTAHRLKSVTPKQPSKSRYLQLADICAGSLQNALEVNQYGRLQVDFFRQMARRLRRWKNRMWGPGFKIYPDDTGIDFGPATEWIDKLRGH